MIFSRRMCQALSSIVTKKGHFRVLLGTPGTVKTGSEVRIRRRMHAVPGMPNVHFSGTYRFFFRSV